MVLSKHAERTPEEQELISQFYATMNESRRSTNYYDFEAANHIHNLSCELSLPAPSAQRNCLIRYVCEYNWDHVSDKFRALFRQVAAKLLEEI